MPIVSLSLPDQMVKAMDEIQDSVGFAGRSELVRAAIRLLLEDTKDLEAADLFPEGRPRERVQRPK